MSDPRPARWFHRLVGDVAILSVIVFVTMLLMNICVHDRHIERERGLLIYTPEVDKSVAIRLSNAMATAGLFDGVRHVFWLGSVNSSLELHVVASPETLRTPENQELLEGAFRQICENVFANEQVIVRLTDEDLEPRMLLFRHSQSESAE